MSDVDVFDLIREAVAYAAPSKLEACRSATYASELQDLGIDSVAALEIAGYIEDRLAATFPDDELASIHTIEGFAHLIRKYAPVTVRAAAS